MILKTKYRSNQTEQVILKPEIILTTNKTRQLFLEDNESFVMDDIVIVEHFPILNNVKGAVNNEYFDENYDI